MNAPPDDLDVSSIKSEADEGSMRADGTALEQQARREITWFKKHLGEPAPSLSAGRPPRTPRPSNCGTWHGGGGVYRGSTW